MAPSRPDAVPNRLAGRARASVKDVARVVAFYMQHLGEPRLRFGFSCAERFRRPPLGAQSRETGMYTWSQPLLIGDTKEERP